MDAAYALFVERGIRDVPIELICDRAGFSRGAFYSNFSSKEELFLTLFREQARARLARTAAVIDDTLAETPGTDDESVRRVVADVLALFLREYVDDANWYMLVAEFRWQGVRQPALRGQIAAAVAVSHRWLGEMIISRFERFGIRVTLGPEEVGQLLAMVHEMLLERALFMGAPPDAQDRYLTHIVPTLVTTFLDR
jgi:AcrR family transcriptional regulator